MALLDVKRRSIEETFDLRLYAGLSGFGIREWHHALRDRFWAKFDLKYGRAPRSSLSEELLTAPLNSAMTDADKNVYLGSVVELDALSAWCFRDELLDDHPDIHDSCQAEWAGWHDQKYLEKIGFTPEMEEAFANIRLKENHDKIINSSFNALKRGGTNLAFLAVTMSTPDDILVESFKAWLKGVRASGLYKNAPVKRFGTSEFGRWIQNRVIPYIDVMLACKIQERRITNHEVGSIIFPEMEFDVAEKVRKTVAPLAKVLLSFEMLDALQLAENEELITSARRR